MLELTLPPEPAESTWSWPDSSRVPEPVRRQIEAVHAQPLERRTDELAQLRSANALLERRIEALERAMRKRARTTVLLDGICTAVAQTIRAEREDVNKRFDELHQKVGDGWRYRGVWTEGCAADVGDVFTCSGSLWYCRAASTAKPGADADAFTLAAKRGRDARDMREPVLK